MHTLSGAIQLNLSNLNPAGPSGGRDTGSLSSQSGALDSRGAPSGLMESNAVKSTTPKKGFRDLVSGARDDLASEQTAANHETDLAGAHVPHSAVPGRQKDAGLGLPPGGKSMPGSSARFEPIGNGSLTVASTPSQLAGEHTDARKPLGAAASQGGVGLTGPLSGGHGTETAQMRGQSNLEVGGMSSENATKNPSIALNAERGLAVQAPKSLQSNSGMTLQPNESQAELSRILNAQSKTEVRRPSALAISGAAEAEGLSAIGKRLGGDALSPVQAAGNRLNMDLELTGDIERHPRAGQAGSASMAQTQNVTSTLTGGVSVALPQAISSPALIASSPAVPSDDALASTLQAAVNRQSAEAVDAMQSQVQRFIALRSSTPGHVSLQLHPRELGRLDMDFRQEGGELQVQITARESQTREMLESVLPRLKASLLELGIQVGKFDIEGGDPHEKPDTSDPAMADTSAQPQDEGDEASESNALLAGEGAEVFDPAQPGQLHITV